MNAQGNLTDIAHQVLAIESLLGTGDFIPAERNPLPAMDIVQNQNQERDQKSSDVNVAQSPSAVDVAQDQKPSAVNDMTSQQKAVALAEIDEKEVRVCTKCPLSQTRTNTVFGEVNPDADLVFVGEAPGADEDACGRPFVGRAGELLSKMIHAMGLTRDDVFICNTVKCRPPGNRPPAPEEASACWDYLIRQLQIIQPRVIVTLGNPATKGLLMTKVGITRLRGNWQQLPDLGEGLAGIPVMPTFHPAYLLRNYSVDARGKVWSDLQAVMESLGLELPKRK